jgi:hypothetical protein
MKNDYKCCNEELSHESAGNRDTETMGGLSVEYMRCDKCGQGYEYIVEREDSLCMNDDKPPAVY